MTLMPSRRRGHGTALQTWPFDDVERVFDRFLSMPRAMTGQDWPEAYRSLEPHMDVSETDDEIAVTVELPGVDPDDVDVTLEQGVLTISGEKRETKEESENGRSYSERRYGRFERSVRLPDTCDPDKVSADTDNGILTVRVAKTEEVKPRRIEVKPRNK